MAIINCTPDSFFDGEPLDVNKTAERAMLAIADGADILDIGGESTRPGSQPVSEEEELKRVIPVIEAIRKNSEIRLSIDTSKANVARAALQAGANIINDVTAGADTAMPKVAAEAQCPVVLMHMKGTPKTMQDHPNYHNLFEEIQQHLKAQTKTFIDAGVHPNNIIWDPGIGFGKTLEHNLALLKNISLWNDNTPVLLGTSRKSFIGLIDPTATQPQARLAGSLATLTLAQHPNVEIFRVHDVSATRQALSVLQALHSTQTS
jgi:dihydropteroate synthase